MEYLLITVLILQFIFMWLCLGFSFTLVKLMYQGNWRADPVSAKGFKASLLGPFAIFVKWEK